MTADVLCTLMLAWMIALVVLQFHRERPTQSPPPVNQASTYQLPREADPEYWSQWT